MKPFLHSRIHVKNTVEQLQTMQTLMLAMFGDHTTIVATAQGFDVSEYEHD